MTEFDGRLIIATESGLFEYVDEMLRPIVPDKRELHIQFKTGGTWTYHDVPAHVADKFHAAESLGTVFMREIRDRYRHTVYTPRVSVPRAGKVHVRLKGH